MFGRSIFEAFVFQTKEDKKKWDNVYTKYVEEKTKEMYEISKEQISRSNRISKMLNENNKKLSSNDFRTTSWYCSAFVDGQMKAEVDQAQRIYIIKQCLLKRMNVKL